MQVAVTSQKKLSENHSRVSINYSELVDRPHITICFWLNGISGLATFFEKYDGRNVDIGYILIDSV